MTPSQSMRDVLREQTIHDVIVLPKGVDLTKRNPSFKSQKVRQQLMADKSREKLLLFVGRLSTEKNIESLRAIFEQREDVNLVIVGDGPDREHLEKYFDGYPVTFTGFLHGALLSQVFASADAFIFPSISETLGQVILEAMASGLPVIAAESEPTIEQINDGYNGLIYQADNPHFLFTALEMLDNSLFKENLIQNSLTYAQQFSWVNTTQTMLNAYEKAIEMHLNRVLMKQNEIA